MHQDDIPSVLLIQEECYPPAMVEAEAVIRSRLAASPDTSWVAQDADGICAYLFAYRSLLGKVTPLGGQFHAADNADSLYLHDLAVAKRANGRGIGPALVVFALESARREGLACSSLVSVQDTRGFWQRQGYAEYENADAEQRARLASYPGPCCYMVKCFA